MTRVKIEKRKIFSKEEKEFIKLKTSGRCGHCGHKLTDDNTTVDHIIPLSKGGINKEENLICLCKECNLEKADMLADPMYYYPYLREEYIEDIANIFQRYIENVSYEQRTNLMCIDILGSYISREEKDYFIKKYLSSSSSFNIMGVNKSLDFRSFLFNLSNIQLRKAVYSDLDEVYQLLVTKLGYSKKDAYDKVDAAFISYSIYVYKLKENIIGFFFLVPRKISKDRDVMLLSIEELYIKYNKYHLEASCLLSGFCSFFLSKKSFSNDFISIQSRDSNIIHFIGRKIKRDLAILKEDTVLGFPIIFVTKGTSSLKSFLYFNDTEYQMWLHKLYCSKQDKLLNPILTSSKLLTTNNYKCGRIYAVLGEPEEYLGKTIVT